MKDDPISLLIVSWVAANFISSNHIFEDFISKDGFEPEKSVNQESTLIVAVLVSPSHESWEYAFRECAGSNWQGVCHIAVVEGSQPTDITVPDL